jgi:prevent-host-death family protein
MTQYMTATQARKELFSLIQMAQKSGKPVIITHEGLPKVVMMSFEEFEGWMETFDIMQDRELSDYLLMYLKNPKKFKGVPWEKVKKDLQR